jgi:hypothetical protein
MSKTDQKVTDKWCDEEDYDSEDGEFGLDASAPVKTTAPKVYKKKEEEKVSPHDIINVFSGDREKRGGSSRRAH